MKSNFLRFYGKHSYPRNILTRSGSLPLYKKKYNDMETESEKEYNIGNKRLFPLKLKLKMMEERLRYLEKEYQEKNDKKFSYQMDNGYLPKLESNSEIYPRKNLYSRNFSRKDYYSEDRYDDDNFSKCSFLNRKKSNKYSKSIDSFALNGKSTKKLINENIRKKIYLPIKNDINNCMNEINYNLEKKIENGNNLMNNNFRNIFNNYNEIKYLLNKKIDKIKKNQNMQYRNLKCELERQKKQINFNSDLNQNIHSFHNSDYLQSQISQQIDEELRAQRKYDEIRWQKELDELRRKNEIESMENKM